MGITNQLYNGVTFFKEIEYVSLLRAEAKVIYFWLLTLQSIVLKISFSSFHIGQPDNRGRIL